MLWCSSAATACNKQSAQHGTSFGVTSAGHCTASDLTNALQSSVKLERQDGSAVHHLTLAPQEEQLMLVTGRPTNTALLKAIAATLYSNNQCFVFQDVEFFIQPPPPGYRGLKAFSNPQAIDKSPHPASWHQPDRQQPRNSIFTCHTVAVCTKQWTSQPLHPPQSTDTPDYYG